MYKAALGTCNFSSLRSSLNRVSRPRARKFIFSDSGYGPVTRKFREEIIRHVKKLIAKGLEPLRESYSVALSGQVYKESLNEGEHLIDEFVNKP